MACFAFVQGKHYPRLFPALPVDRSTGKATTISGRQVEHRRDTVFKEPELNLFARTLRTLFYTGVDFGAEPPMLP